MSGTAKNQHRPPTRRDVSKALEMFAALSGKPERETQHKNVGNGDRPVSIYQPTPGVK